MYQSFRGGGECDWSLNSRHGDEKDIDYGFVQEGINTCIDHQGHKK